MIEPCRVADLESDPEFVVVAAADYDVLYELAREMGKRLESAALTSHARGITFCKGDFANCPTCQPWRDTIQKWKAFNTVTPSDTFTLPTEVPDEFNF